jgi:rhomboid protease GluP
MQSREPADPSDDDPEVLEFSADMLAPTPRKGVDFERGMSHLPPLSVTLICLLGLVFAWELTSGALNDKASLIRAGALERQAVLDGQVWRLFTSTLLHGSVDHLVGNCVALFLVGMAVEHAFGSGGAAAIYFCSGIAGACMSVVAETGPTVGASGAIFGWWGAAIVFFYRHRQRLLTRDVRVGSVLLIWAAWTIASGFLNPQISNFSHLGGLVMGASLAMVLPSRLPELHAASPDD